MSSTGFPIYRRSFDPDQRFGRHLVEYCTNEWRNEPNYRYEPSPERTSYSDDFLDCLEDYWGNTVTVVKAPKFRRLLLTIVVATVALVVLCVKIWPVIKEERAILASVNKNAGSASGGLFGINVRPQFPGMIQVQTLDPRLLPQASNSQGSANGNKKRLIFIGDIHGCKKEVEALLKEVQFDPVTDHLVALGDVVSKGPDSPGVIDLLRGYNASCVRGNHDDRLLLFVEDLHSTSLTSQKNPNFASNAAAQASLNKDNAVRNLAMSLDAAQVEWLKSCPVILRIGELRAFQGETVAVHGGLVLGIPLEQQDPVSVMNLRTVDMQTHVPSQKHEEKGGKSKAWYKLWNKHQQLLDTRQGWNRLKSFGKKKSAEKPMTVIYGHDSKTGLKIKKYTKGLDTGCVKGGKLTALVVNGDGKQELVQVDCKDRRQASAGRETMGDILKNGKSKPPVDNSD
ncbi:hypothetical protein LTR99_008448 [Exophiala xenobiotica]|uniref:Calcineurin-like phosphoesterase domain-containing protein n=1 Tax=Vermiconidia calcicola TaxID=1690605 RepID=A0AAV9Q2R9_9PEZI|nr:hypothetical protein LTR92_008403 [Exophiala xenobiotica]KAK5532838.1 hypothetical protein LTR25_007542 [Vermiconidia calcicola]KAK5546567.1 hypothetical protein LTR23_003314 [Chaetothyriales sp. CCFEE 6169]KAK5270085.1 hypothetical protein LTR96_004585 [Exophiala xenobiotica]KAK5296807.1 hypothetical protein LTR99_008448 [Exophiala xenobiotica]